MSKTQKLSTTDPLGTTHKLIGRIMDDGFAGHLAASADAEPRLDMLRTVMIVQAINRLTEAVQENTEAVERNNSITATTIAGRMSRGGVVVDVD